MRYSWIPVLVVGLTWLEGIIESHTWAVLQSAPIKMTVLNAGIILLVILLNLSWLYFPLPVTLYYLLYYLIRMLHYSRKKEHMSRDLFFINLGFVNYLVLHLTIIGMTALIQNTSMSALLGIPFWRAVSVVFCSGANIIETTAVWKRKSFSDSLNAEAESTEARLLTVFLMFCTVYLLLDSLLCFSDSEPVYTALFLIGGCVILVSVLILYLWYIKELLRNRRLKDENVQLEAELVFHDQKTGTLRQMTDRDTMTGAYSRRYGIRQLEQFLHSGQVVSISFLDLDHLKIINDREGHEAGDQYLIDFVEALKKQLGGNGIVSRIGGDEFMILLPGYSYSAAKQCMGKIRSALEKREKAFFFSFGISSCPVYGQCSVEEMIRKADLNMYQDKRRRH